MIREGNGGQADAWLNRSRRNVHEPFRCSAAIGCKALTGGLWLWHCCRSQRPLVFQNPEKLRELSQI